MQPAKRKATAKLRLRDVLAIAESDVPGGDHEQADVGASIPANESPMALRSTSSPYRE